MNIVIRQTWNFCRYSLTVCQSASAGLFGLGMFLGIIAVTMWQQWSLTFGQDPEFLVAVSLVISLSLWIGQRWQPTQSTGAGRWPLAALISGLAAWSCLHPFWIDTLTIAISQLPMSYLENATFKPMVAMSLAVLGWLVPGLLWTAVVVQASTSTNQLALSNRNASRFLLSGIAGGLLLNSLVLSPSLGLYVPTVSAAVIVTILGLWNCCFTVNRGSSVATGNSDKSNRSIENKVLCSGMALLVGSLLACNLRLVNQLMPHGSYVIYVQLAGAMFGIAFGLLFTPKQRTAVNRASWGGLIAAAASSFLLAIQPLLVDLSLWLNASLMTVTFLLAARALLLMAIAFPFGIALAWIADSRENNSDSHLIRWSAPFAAGLGTATFVLGGMVGLVPLMTGCVCLLVIAAGILCAQSSVWSISIRTASVMGCLAVLALTLPLWRHCDDAARTAKILFSTPTFIAYRSGWDIRQLPFLDDVRMIDRCENQSGPLTLWRGRVAELYVREAGMPRAVVTKNSDAVPQFAPEVLQAVYSLVLCDRPRRVLLLGLSAGVPLATCLDFPIREAVCVEGDSQLVALVRGPLKRETGFDPLTDDRVTLRQVSPELALMTSNSEPYDVVLSCPTSSSIMEGAASFTEEFYQRASRQLTERGLFCQRFECVDYGPEPLQMVLKAMRTAFQRVIVIETTVGELLLFATNSEDVFVPADLSARMEMPHVRRILARSGLDWSALLNQPAYDHEALGEVCDETRLSANSTMTGRLAAMAPMEIMRWGNKLHDVQALLTSTRLTPAPFWKDRSTGEPNWVDNEIQLSRRSRLIEWLGDGQVSKELVRRLEEVVTQQKLVRENPDAHWWEYRNKLKKQLQDRPRSAIQQVKAMDEKHTLHPEDIRRRDYFLALGNAARQPVPTRKQIAAVEEFLEPYDPLISYFARQETADMLARSGEDTALELAYRLHVIYFTPTVDASVRNVAKAIETVVNHPEALSNDSIRYDALNGLIQTLRVRWEIRQSIPETSSRKILDDVDQSLLAVEKGVTSLEGVYASAGVPDHEWQIRKHVIERLMLRPLRAYRTEVQSRQLRGRAQAKAILDEAGDIDDEAK